MTSRKKPGVAFWATVAVVVVLVAYPLSFGPLVWLDSRGLLPAWAEGIMQIYCVPLISAGDNSRTVEDLYMW